jgi:hypothetical protein
MRGLKLHAMIGLILGAEKRSPGEVAIKGIANLIENNFDDPVTASQNGHRYQII